MRYTLSVGLLAASSTEEAGERSRAYSGKRVQETNDDTIVAATQDRFSQELNFASVGSEYPLVTILFLNPYRLSSDVKS